MVVLSELAIPFTVEAFKTEAKRASSCAWVYEIGMAATRVERDTTDSASLVIELDRALTLL